MVQSFCPFQVRSAAGERAELNRHFSRSSDPGLARELVRQALNVFEEGVRWHYYLPSDIEPITSYIRQHVPIKLS